MKLRSLNLLLLSAVVVLCSGCNGGRRERRNFAEGDFLFQVLNGEALDSAITEVTAVSGKPSFAHCAMVIKVADSLAIIEAIGDSVQVTSFAEFYARSGDSCNVVAKRLKREYRKYIPSAVSFAMSKRGQLYDIEYLPNNGKWYCSELLAEAFNEAARGSGRDAKLFPFHPMTFKNPDTGTFPQTWIDYYADLGIPIPEGELGNNPNDLAGSDLFK